MIKTTVKQEGFESILLPGDGRTDRVMIVMSGSNGGMSLTLKCAEFYDKHGIPALALALFATKGTQPFLDRVPVEYVENAVKWLKARGYRRVGIDGMSKGSEMALLAASMLPDISLVTARVPSHFISEGLTGRGKGKTPSGTSCWSYKGKQLPFAPYKTQSFNIIGRLLKERELNILPFNSDKEITPECLIPITEIKAPVLLLSSKNDTVWPSYESAAHMERVLGEAAFPFPHRHAAFEYMSHMMVTRPPFLYRFLFKTERRHPKECAADRQRLEGELLDWVNTAWEK